MIISVGHHVTPIVEFCSEYAQPFRLAISFVRLIGLEPTRPKSPDPKSGASTNFATSAERIPFAQACGGHTLQR